MHAGGAWQSRGLAFPFLQQFHCLHEWRFGTAFKINRDEKALDIYWRERKNENTDKNEIEYINFEFCIIKDVTESEES